MCPRIRMAVMATLFTVLWPARAPATEQIVGRELADISAAVESHGCRVLVYQAADGSAPNLFLTPFFVLKADKDGKLVVQCDEPRPGERTCRVTVFLLVSPAPQVEAIAQRIRANERARLPQPGPYANVRPANLITIALRDLKVVEDSPRPLFAEVTLKGNSNQGEYPLTAEVPAEQAAAFADRLRDGRVSVTFKLSAKLNARKTDSEVILRAKVFHATESEAYKKLKGGSGMFHFSAGDTAGSVQPASVTREQKDRIGADLLREVEACLEITGRPEHQQWLMEQFKLLLADAFSPHVIHDHFGRQLSRLYAYDFSPADLAPDKLDKIVADVQRFFASKEHEYVFTEADGSASVAGIFGAKVNVKYSREHLMEIMKNNSWRFEAQGGVTIPRSLDVYVVNHEAFKTRGTFRGRVDVGSLQGMQVEALISTTNRLDPSKPMPTDPRLTAVQAARERMGDALKLLKEVQTSLRLLRERRDVIQKEHAAAQTALVQARAAEVASEQVWRAWEAQLLADNPFPLGGLARTDPNALQQIKERFPKYRELRGAATAAASGRAVFQQAVDKAQMELEAIEKEINTAAKKALNAEQALHATEKEVAEAP